MTNERSAAEQIEQLVTDGTIAECRWGHYGLPTYTIDGCTYAYAESDEEADEAAKAYIADSVWASCIGFGLIVQRG